MRRFSPLPIVLVTALATLLVFTACQQASPEEQIAAKRAEYTVKLNSWYPEVENVSLEVTEEPMDAEGDAAAEGDEAGDEMAEDKAEDMAEGESGDDTAGDDLAGDTAMAGPQPHTIVLDLLVLYDGRGEPLPGLTVKVTQVASADENAEEIGSWLQYLEMPPMTKGVSEQVGFQLEGVPFEQGNLFAVSLVKNVPAEERSQYREFQSAGG